MTAYTWEDVKGHLQDLNGYPLFNVDGTPAIWVDGDIYYQTVINTLQFVYNRTTDTVAMTDFARAMAVDPNFQLRIGLPPPGTPGEAIPGILNGIATAYFDVDSTAGALFFNPYGVLTSIPSALVLFHEIHHALSGQLDNYALNDAYLYSTRGTPSSIDSTFDGLGPTVRFQNQLAHDLGYDANNLNSKIEASYQTVVFLTDVRKDYLAVQQSYTGGNHVDLVQTAINPRIDPAQGGGFTGEIDSQTIDFSRAGQRVTLDSDQALYASAATGNPADELLIAFKGANTIISGGGNDFLYGGVDGDTLAAGAGNNFIDGGNNIGSATGPVGLARPYWNDGLDTVKYSGNDPVTGALITLGAGNGTNFGAVMTLDAGNEDGAQTFLGKNEIVVSDNGFNPDHPGVDHLFSIERIEGVKKLDIKNLDISSYALTANADESEPTLLWIKGWPGFEVDFSFSGKDVSFGATLDTSAPSYAPYRALLDDGTATGIALTMVNHEIVKGSENVIHFDDYNPINHRAGTIDLEGDSNGLDFTGTSWDDFEIVQLKGNNNYIAGGLGGLYVTDYSGNGTLLLPKNWEDYYIYTDPADPWHVSFEAKDFSSAHDYNINGINNFQFGDSYRDINDVATKPQGLVPISTTPISLTNAADIPSGTVTQAGSFTDSNNLVHHAISVSHAGTAAGILTASITTDTTGSVPVAGAYSLSYAIDPAIFDGMMDSQAISETWKVVITPDTGAAKQFDDTISISRSNLMHVTSVTLGMTIEAGNAPSQNQIGEIAFSDGNKNDVHTASATFKSSSTGGSPLGSFSTHLQDTAVGQVTGTVGWTYDAANVNPVLHTAQTVTEVWTIAISDGHGGTTNQDVTVTIQTPASANQAPVVGALAPIGIGQDDLTTTIDLLQTASDPENAILTVVAGSFAAAASDGRIAQISVQNGIVTIDPSQFKDLGAGQDLVLSFGFDVTDGIDFTHGAGTLLVHGENDAPTAVPITSATATERDAIHTIDLLQTATDPDQGATLSVFAPSVVVASSDGHATVGVLAGNSISIDPGQFKYLHAGQSLDVTVGYDISDGMATVHNTAVLTVTGVDSAPTISPIAVGNVDQNDAVRSIDLLQTAADLDGNDTVSVVASSLSRLASDGHVVAYTLVNGVLQIDPSQFSYLRAGQTDAITIGYDVTDGQTVVHNTATLTMVGEDDPAAVPQRVVGGTTQTSGTFLFNGLSDISTPDAGIHSYSIVSGSVSATSSDGHAVTVGNTAGSPSITLNPAQFAYLGAGEFVTVTIGYDVAVAGLGTTAGTAHATPTLVVLGTEEGPVIVPPSTISVVDTSASDNFATVSGTLAATDTDIHDGQFWSPFGYAMVQATIVSPIGAVIVLPDGEFTFIPSAQKINSLRTGSSTQSFAVQVDDGHGGRSNSTIKVGYTVADDAPTAPYFATGGAILEHATNGTLIGTLKVVDLDTTDTASWTLIDNAGGRFALSASGQLSVANGTLLDHADTAGYDIVVKEADTAGLYVQQSVHVILLQMPTATIAGTSGADTPTGTSGDDAIVGLAGNDTINAGSGDDLVLPGSGTNHSDGGAGNDTISYVDLTAGIVADLGAGTVVHNSVTDTAANFENLRATSFDDTIIGTTGANVVDAGAGNDRIYARGGADVIDGGIGTDTVYFDDATVPITVDLQTGVIGGAAAGVTLLNVEGVVGGSGNDVLTGLATAASIIAGGAGDDVLTGGTGNDTLDGGTGHDTVYGSAGADTIADVDDLVLDYTGSPMSVVLYSTGSYGYAGIGGYADGDVVTLGDAAHLGSARLELHLPDYSSGVILNPYDINVVYGGAGNDDIYVTDGTNFAVHSQETLYGGAGYDIIHPGNDGYDTIDFATGGGVLDYQTATGYVNFHWAEPGGTGTVEVYSGTTVANIADHGQTTVTGDFETFEGGKLADTIFGNSQDNFIFGNGGSDTIDAGAGNDHISAVGNVHGGAGDDTILVTGTPTTGAGTSNVYGDAGNDAIVLQSGSTTDIVLRGGAGNDVIDATAGSTGTILHGGGGADILKMNSTETLSYDDAIDGIAIDGISGTGGDALGDVILGGPKTLIGSNFGDTIADTAFFEIHLGTGNNLATNNSGAVYGNTGNDTIRGTSNADTIHTGGGNDTVWGGGGADQFFFDHLQPTDSASLEYAYGDGTDTINGFLQGHDSIDISRMAGLADPTISLTQLNGDTKVNIAWDASHHETVTLHGVLLSSFAAGQDYHLI